MHYRKVVAGKVESYRIGFNYNLAYQPHANLNSVSVSVFRLAKADASFIEEWACRVQFRAKRRPKNSPTLVLQPIDCLAIATLLANITSTIIERWPAIRISLDKVLRDLGQEYTHRIIEQAIVKLRYANNQFEFVYHTSDIDPVIEAVPLGTRIIDTSEES